ncbi:MAG: DNA polymerase III subunit gamma/tau [Bacteroidales bacterium]|jgi:DNA polymerase-3 subunit gamma/tau|nr:DNA polymerase III subunit gamma/tau [Bacteroidales bacterium]MCI1733802.1 DNA polymerase III subunit gamma/tau [Bacteroidales bacterium]
MEKFIVSARKYRPATFSTLIGQDSIATTLKNSIKRGQLAHAYLFCGPRGVGKTTTARIFAKTINCMNPGPDMEPCGECESCKSFDEGRSYCIHELDAASNNSVDDIRALTEKVMIPPQIGKYSVYIIDEVHMLSTAAFNAFLKTLEEPPAHAIFILATTEKQKIIPTILSRCQVFDFNRISIPDIVKNLKQIAEKEQVTIDDESLHVIAQKADGAMRDALTLFDQVVAFCGNTVKYEEVIKNLNVLDYDYYFRLTDLSLNGDFANSLVLFDDVLRKGFNALYFVDGLGNHLRNLLVCKESASAKLLEVSPALEKKYNEQAQKCPLKFLFNALASTEKCAGEFNRSGNQRLLVEFMLVRISQITGAKPVAQPAAQPVVAPAVQPVAAPAAQPVKAEAPATEPVATAQPAQAGATAPEPTKAVATESSERMERSDFKRADSSATATQPAAAQPTAAQPVAATAQPAVVQAGATAAEPTKAVATESSAATATQPAAAQPATQPAANGISIASLMAKAKQQDTAAKTPEKPLDFMGPSEQEEVTIEKVKKAWEKLATEYTTKYPTLVKFAATIKNTVPVLEEDNLTVDFLVGNSNQKMWIEKNAGKQMADFLRKNLNNKNVHLAIKIKTQEQIGKKMYLPEEQEDHIKNTNSEVAKLKDDLGLQLK